MEVFGVVTGAISLTSLFSACVDCFEYVELGRTFRRDYRTSILTLTCARLRLTRWGQAVNINNNSRFQDLSLESADEQIKTAKATLEQILVLFRDASNISGNYEGVPPSVEIDNNDQVAVLDRTLRSIAHSRRTGPRLLQTTRWALHDKSRLDRLVNSIGSLVDNLEQLFPVEPAILEDLTRQEIASVPKPQLPLLSDAAGESRDKKLQAAAHEASIGHEFDNIIIRGKGTKGLNGDSFLKGWDGRALGASHKYRNITVEEGAASLQGNQYGASKGIFDD